MDLNEYRFKKRKENKKAKKKNKNKEEEQKTKGKKNKNKKENQRESITPHSSNFFVSEIKFFKTETNSSAETQICFMESRSRMVTVFFSSVSKSIVTEYGIPISSFLL